nr:hypothetical protein [Tanacetum cinerariifolium]
DKICTYDCYANIILCMIYWIGWVRLLSIYGFIGSDGYAYPVFVRCLDRIGCKVMRTLASVEIEVMLILGLSCCLSSSSVRCFESSEPFEESEGFGTSNARSTSSDSIAPLSPDHPLTHTTPVLVPILRRTARMVVRVPHVMSPGLSAGMVDVAAMSDLAFCKSEEDEEVEESSDSNSESEDIEDEGPTAEDEGLAARVEGLGVDDESYGLDGESHGVDDESYGLDGEEEVVPKGQQRAVSIVGTPVSEPLGLGYWALRCRDLALEGDHTPPLPEWTSGSLPISPSPFVVPLPVSSPMIPLTVPSPIASPMATSTATISVDKDQFIEERTAVTFGALWRPVLALETWAGRVDTRMTDMARAWYDDHRLVHDMLLQQTALQRELQEMRDRVTVLEQERDRSERISTPLFVDPESSTQADRAQSSRVPVPLPEDPYKAIRQAYLAGTNTESEPFEEGSGTSGARSTSSGSTAPLSPDHPFTHTTPVLVPILRRTIRMAVYVPLVMSHGLYTGMAEVAAMSDSAFPKRFRSSYDSLPSLTLSVRKRDSYERPFRTWVWGVETSRVSVRGGSCIQYVWLGHGSGFAPEPERSNRVSTFRQPILTTWTDPKDGMIYIDVLIYPPPAPPVQTPPSPEWTSGSLSQALNSILALYQDLCESGSPSPPFILLKLCGISTFLGPGSSGGGKGFLPTGF